MTMTRFEIVFSGQLVAGAAIEPVQANLARLFQADAQRIALLFSGRRMVIKNNLDAASAEKYRMTLERAGARAEVVAMAAEEIELSAPPAPAVRTAPAALAGSPMGTASQAAPGRLQVLPRDEYMAAFVDVDAPDFGIAELGVDLQDARPAAVAPAVDLTQFSLAPAGSDMGQIKQQSAAAAPDTSHLKLQE
jgi:hypothetical protein